MFFVGKSIINLLTNSSTKEDFPEPPVPVIPRTGVLELVAIFFDYNWIWDKFKLLTVPPASLTIITPAAISQICKSF